MRARPSSEPTASPSGDRWLVSRKRLPCRISASRFSGALFVIVVMVQRLQKGGDLNAVLGPAVELEDQLGGRAHAQAVGELGTQETGGMAQGGDRLFARRLLAQHRDADARPPQVGGDVHLRH